MNRMNVPPVIYFNTVVGVCAGMVQSRPGVCLGWVLCSEWSAGLSQTPVLPAGSPGKSRTRDHYWPHSPSLQLCVLCLPCPWEQVCPDLYFQSLLNRTQVNVIMIIVFNKQKIIFFRPDLCGNHEYRKTVRVNFCLPSFLIQSYLCLFILCYINLSVCHVFLFNVLYRHIFSCVLPFFFVSFSLSFVAIVSYYPYYSSSHAPLKSERAAITGGRWATRP